ncbi:hypothetical protein LLE49_22195 [Alicyclobacillus tolerans]|uniref:hypothetical protein n=1 Tax=Alicyclobacillus tolerans TaxID=90970 RepID=UPI001F2DBB9A|nr:hypothetical protein [Alicyclobacillus tolerans]MCF8567433.1 hypothetical protein [Alicyclobacillus tolerans]
MTVLITRFWWMVVSLMLLFGMTFIVLYTHTATVVLNAANSAREIAAITGDTSALQQTVAKNIEASLPVSENGQTLFNPATDIVTTDLNQNQNVQLSVTYHMPVLGPLQTILGLTPTIPVTRTVTQALDYAHNGLHANLSTISPSPIGMSSVVMTTSGNQITMTVNGYGFGSAPAGVPGTTKGNYFIFRDITQGWEAGSPASGLAVTYGNWQDHQILVTGIQNFGKGTEIIQPGDNAQVTVTSPQGSATYDFVAQPAGVTNYHVSLSASATSVPTATPVTLTAATSVPGDGTNGVGIYNATTGTYLGWSASGDTVSQLVNSGSSQSQDYIAYYGPKDQISQAIATSPDVGVTWTGGQTNIQAVLFETQSGGWMIDVMGENLSGTTISGNGLSSPIQISSGEIQVQAASLADTSGVVTFSNGTQVPFTATPY